MKNAKKTVLVGTLVAAFALAGSASADAQAVIVPSSGFSFLESGDLTVGSRGLPVIDLQGLLQELGHMTMPAGAAPGYFGTVTRAGVARYQTALGVTPAAGYFGPITRSAVRANLSAVYKVNFTSAGVTVGTGSTVTVAPNTTTSTSNPPSGMMALGTTGYWHQGNWYSSLPTSSSTVLASIPGYWYNGRWYSSSVTNPSGSQPTGSGYWYNGVWYTNN